MVLSILILKSDCQPEEETSSGGDQLVSNKVDAYTKKGVGHLIVQPLLFSVSYMAKENSFVVRQIHVPFDKIYPMAECQSSMQVQVIFKMAKEAFNAICCVWNKWV